MLFGRANTFGEQVLRNFKPLTTTATFREHSKFYATIFSVVSIFHIIFEPIDVTDRMRGLCQPGKPSLLLVRRSRCQMSEGNLAPSS